MKGRNTVRPPRGPVHASPLKFDAKLKVKKKEEIKANSACSRDLVLAFAVAPCASSDLLRACVSIRTCPRTERSRRKRTAPCRWTEPAPAKTRKQRNAPVSMAALRVAAGGAGPHRAAALVHPDAAPFLLRVRGLQSQEVLSGAQAVVVTQHAHDQVQRVSVQHVLVTRARRRFHGCFFLSRWVKDVIATTSPCDGVEHGPALLYSRIGPVTPLWRRTWTRPGSSLCLRERKAASRLAEDRADFTASLLNRRVSLAASHLSCIDVADEVQRLLEGLAHVELQLLYCSHILHPELGVRFRRAVAYGDRVNKQKGRGSQTETGEIRLTGTLGGVCVKTGDCAGPGQASQAGVHRLGALKNTGWHQALSKTTEKWSK